MQSLYRSHETLRHTKAWHIRWWVGRKGCTGATSLGRKHLLPLHNQAIQIVWRRQYTATDDRLSLFREDIDMDFLESYYIRHLADGEN